MKKIRVGIVNYLNTKPLIYGLEREPIASQIELIGDYPANVARKLINDEVDIGLIPVAVLPQIPGYNFVGNYCIGTQGEIASVAMFSEVPMNEIKRVWLDYQSRTSVALLKYLLREAWGINPEILDAENEDFRKEIKGTTAGLVIGDRALEQRHESTFIYDLGSEWRAITGLPFVFAAWVSKKPFSDAFTKLFDEANAMGMQHLDEIVAANPFAPFDMKKYYSLHLSYELDARKRAAIEKFLSLIQG